VCLSTVSVVSVDVWRFSGLESSVECGDNLKLPGIDNKCRWDGCVYAGQGPCLT
jgi:hypothetical protein